MGDVPDADLSFLPAEFLSSAIRTETGEVVWPLAVGPAVVNAIADAGRLILGLDLRSDGGGGTATGLATEVPWSAFRPEAVGRDARVEAAREDALKALKRRRTTRGEMSGYDWVVITWQAHNVRQETSRRSPVDRRTAETVGVRFTSRRSTPSALRSEPRTPS